MSVLSADCRTLAVGFNLLGFRLSALKIKRSVYMICRLFPAQILQLKLAVANQKADTRQEAPRFLRALQAESHGVVTSQ